MTERRETGQSRTSKRPARPNQNSETSTQPAKARSSNWEDGDRIAKYLAHAGVCSRRDAEGLIEQGKVTVNGRRLDSPAFKVTRRDTIRVDGQVVKAPENTRLWRYHKPAGLITATRDPDGRSTIFDHLPKHLPRVVTVGRLDLTTEGLLILTNDGELARQMELPSTGLERHYRARAHGKVTPEALAELAKGVIVDGVEYAPMQIELERTTGTNNWLSVVLKEGKNREVRKALASVGLTVNRLIRIQYGPFVLGDLASGVLDEINPDQIAELLGGDIRTDRMARPKPRSQGRGPNTRSGRKTSLHRRRK